MLNDFTQARFWDILTLSQKTSSWRGYRISPGCHLTLYTNVEWLHPSQILRYTYFITENIRLKRLQNISWLSSNSIQMLNDFTQARFWDILTLSQKTSSWRGYRISPGCHLTLYKCWMTSPRPDSELYLLYHRKHQVEEATEYLLVVI